MAGWFGDSNSGSLNTCSCMTVENGRGLFNGSRVFSDTGNYSSIASSDGFESSEVGI